MILYDSRAKMIRPSMISEKTGDSVSFRRAD